MKNLIFLSISRTCIRHLDTSSQVMLEEVHANNSTLRSFMVGYNNNLKILHLDHTEVSKIQTDLMQILE